ncbi:MAG: hypothetical protein HLUCCX14_15185 [Marinobacter excellens HL-55]|uniref:DUF4157 domain-containing protein n=1 Tax=Marinobacter excellens HL-55 TaxID=1305731 RepID=A0A0P7Z5Z3_9GAMM|nr:MAG: hypothetical protein HLUCCX14_15185 [Marinobacter excellens HL-55]
MVSGSMIGSLEAWARQLKEETASRRTACAALNEHFHGFYSKELLAKTSFVVVDRIPPPPLMDTLPQVSRLDFSKFSGLTLGDTYYVVRSEAQNLPLHFHELVHVLQWKLLTARGFLTRYLNEVIEHGYHDAPLEIMAYDLGHQFEVGCLPFDVESTVRQKLSDIIKS